MKIRYLVPLLTVSLTMILFGCDQQKPQENKQPDVEMSEEKIPSYEIDSPAAAIGNKEPEIEVPDAAIPNTDSDNQ